MKFNVKVLEVWAKWFVGNLVTAIVVIGKTPIDLTSSDWKRVANTLWLALVPVIIKWYKEDDFNFRAPKK